MATLDNDDKKWLIDNFVTKKDNQQMEKRLDKKFTELFNFLDRDSSKLTRRVRYIDHHLDIDTSNL